MPAAPGSYTPENVTVRLIDALVYRYRAALDGLAPEHLEQSVHPGSMTIAQLQQHIFALAKVTYVGVTGDSDRFQYSVAATFTCLAELRAALLDQPDVLARSEVHGKPFWHAISGPLADALTHVGQINLMKPMLGAERTSGRYFS